MMGRNFFASPARPGETGPMIEASQVVACWSLLAIWFDPLGGVVARTGGPAHLLRAMAAPFRVSANQQQSLCIAAFMLCFVLDVAMQHPIEGQASAI